MLLQPCQLLWRKILSGGQRSLEVLARQPSRRSFEPVGFSKPTVGTVTLPNRARNKSAGMLGSRRSDDVAPGLHRRGPEGSVRFCGGEMALDVESVVSGCVGGEKFLG